MGIPIIGDVIDAVGDIVSEAIVDVDKKKEIELELEKLRDAAEARLSNERIAQMEINKAEAQHGSVFVAGWRPFVGWVCGVGLAAQVILFPLLAAVFKTKFEFDTELLLLTMSGMLGIGAMRTVEKIKGVSTNNYTDVPKKKGEPENILPPLYSAQLPEETSWMK